MKRILVLVFMLLFLGSLVSAEYAAAWDRFVNNKDGTVSDMQTGLMWADRDNGSDINWPNAQSYCNGYSGGGKSGWRMPTIDELGQLRNSDVFQSVIIRRTGRSIWSSETRDSEAADFNFSLGDRNWTPQYIKVSYRALPVRSGK